MRTAERVCNPEGGVVRIVVIIAIIPVGPSIAAAAVEAPDEILASAYRRKFKPTGGDGRRCEGVLRAVEGVTLQGIVLGAVHRDEGLVVVGRAGGESGKRG